MPLGCTSVPGRRPLTTITLISAGPGDRVPGHELADPDCPLVPGLLDLPAVAAWMEKIGYGPDAEDELVYLTTGPALVPPGFDVLTLEV